MALCVALEIPRAHLAGEAGGIAFPDDAGVLQHIDAVGMRQREGHVLLAQQHRDVGVVCRSRSSAFDSCSRITGASPSVGSSRISSFGCIISARAIASICCSPPDSVRAAWRWRDCEDREQVEQPVELPRALRGGQVLAAEIEVLAHAHVAEQLAGLRALHDAAAGDRGRRQAGAAACPSS